MEIPVKIALVERPDQNYDVLIGRVKVGAVMRRSWPNVPGRFWVIRSMEHKLSGILYNTLNEVRAELIKEFTSAS